MLQKTIKILFFALLLSIQTSFAQADQKWISVTLFTGQGKDTTGEYFGMIDETELDQITKERNPQGMFQLSSVYWLDTNGKVVKMKDVVINGVKYGYSDTVYFRQDDIDRIALLDNDYVDSLLNNKKP